VSELSVVELFEGSSVIELISSTQPGWTCLNPSIAQSTEGDYRCIIRSGNFRPDGRGGYAINDPEGIVRTKNYFAVMDDSLSIHSLDLIDDSAVKDVQWPMVQGMEDARLYFARDGKWHAYGTLREHRWDGNCEIAEDTLEGNTIVLRKIHSNPEPGRTQKNWAILGQGPKFVYLCGPAVTIEDGVTWNGFGVNPGVGEFRGGSQAIKHGDGYISIVHEVTWEPLRNYHHRFVQYDSEGFVTHYSPSFYLLAPGIEFAAGIVRHGNDFVVSFGHGDVRALLARVPISGVHKSWISARP
jgi:hypothetical protein